MEAASRDAYARLGESMDALIGQISNDEEYASLTTTTRRKQWLREYLPQLVDGYAPPTEWLSSLLYRQTYSESVERDRPSVPASSVATIPPSRC